MIHASVVLVSIKTTNNSIYLVNFLLQLIFISLSGVCYIHTIEIVHIQPIRVLEKYHRQNYGQGSCTSAKKVIIRDFSLLL